MKRPLDILPVETHYLSKYFGCTAAVDGVDLSVGVGEVVLLVGQNGAGKSSLLRLLAGLSRPSEGNITYGTHDTHDSQSYLHQQVGYISDNTLLYHELSVRENLSFAARLYDIHDADSRMDEVLDLVGIRHRENDEVRKLSRGLMQRVSIARALIPAPSLFLFDEPFSGLDEHSAEILETILNSVRESRRAAIVATHALDRCLPVATRAVVLERGRIVDDVAVDPAETHLRDRLLGKGASHG